MRRACRGGGPPLRNKATPAPLHTAKLPATEPLAQSSHERRRGCPRSSLAGCLDLQWPQQHCRGIGHPKCERRKNLHRAHSDTLRASSRFDLVVIPQHDALPGDNVLVTRRRCTASQGKARRSSANFRREPAPLPGLDAVLLGGLTSSKVLARILPLMADQLIAAARDCGGSLPLPRRAEPGRQRAILRDHRRRFPFRLGRHGGKSLLCPPRHRRRHRRDE